MSAFSTLYLGILPIPLSHTLNRLADVDDVARSAESSYGSLSCPKLDNAGGLVGFRLSIEIPNLRYERVGG